MSPHGPATEPPSLARLALAVARCLDALADHDPRASGDSAVLKGRADDARAVLVAMRAYHGARESFSWEQPAEAALLAMAPSAVREMARTWHRMAAEHEGGEHG